jgi:hypothetical protein
MHKMLSLIPSTRKNQNHKDNKKPWTKLRSSAESEGGLGGGYEEGEGGCEESEGGQAAYRTVPGVGIW